MRRESPVRFLGGGGAAMRRCYPTAVVKIVMPNKRNWLSRLTKMVMEGESRVGRAHS